MNFSLALLISDRVSHRAEVEVGDHDRRRDHGRVGPFGFRRPADIHPRPKPERQ